MPTIPIHNWEDEDYYSDLRTETDLTRWGWEFLRRNPEYQKDYQLFSSLPDFNKEGNDTKNGKYRGSPYRDGRFYIDMFHYTNPPALIGEVLTDYDIRCPYGEVMPYAHYLEKKYHFQPTPLDPLTELTEDIWFYFSDINDDSAFGSDFPPWEIDLQADYEIFSSHPKIYKEYEDKYLERIKSYGSQKSTVIFAFDYTQPIQKQIDRVKFELLELQKEDKEEKIRLNFSEENENIPFVPSIRLIEFPTYIRLLDAKAAGIKQAAITEKLKSSESKVSKNIAKAEEWSLKNYWKMWA